MKDFMLGTFLGLMMGICIMGILTTPFSKNQTIARREAERDSPPENYFGDTVHYECIWTTPEKNAVEKYPGYRAIKTEKLKGEYWVTLVWNDRKWPPDTLKEAGNE